jgi:Leucine-rich repeat (LRR) protein
MEKELNVVDGFCNLAGLNLSSLDDYDFTDVKGNTLYLNLSHNMLISLEFLAGFHNLKSLHLDYNQIQTLETLPYLRNLETLSLVSNQITNLDDLLRELALKVPSLTNLSLLMNACSPTMDH